VTQTSEIPYGAEIRIDPIPHRDSDATQKIRDGVEFNNGVAASQLGLGNSPLVSGLLTAALNDGEVLADDGSVHESVQAAQDAASSYIFIGPGTFNENVTIDTTGLTVQGSGYNTLIDGGSDGQAINVNANNVIISRITAKTTNGGNNTRSAIEVTSSNVLVKSCKVTEADEYGINAASNAENVSIVDNIIENANLYGVAVRGRSIVSGCTVKSSGNGFRGANESANVPFDNIYSNCIALNVDGNGFKITDDDSIVIGCRCSNAGIDGIVIQGVDNIIANNRISDSGSTNISDVGTGTVLDGNNTGSAN
jgi:hypothetical protein